MIVLAQPSARQQFEVSCVTVCFKGPIFPGLVTERAILGGLLLGKAGTVLKPLLLCASPVSYIYYFYIKCQRSRYPVQSSAFVR